MKNAQQLIMQEYRKTFDLHRTIQIVLQKNNYNEGYLEIITKYPLIFSRTIFVFSVLLVHLCDLPHVPPHS